jgi:ERCC4-type nuclease
MTTSLNRWSSRTADISRGTGLPSEWQSARLRSDGPEETARLLLFAARQLRSAVSGGLPRHGWRPKGKRAIQLRILQGLPQLGPARAERLLDAFGSVEAVLNAAPQELCAIRGIGADTAKKIRWALS